LRVVGESSITMINGFISSSSFPTDTRIAAQSAPTGFI
jgi:hypothetical protein